MRFTNDDGDLLLSKVLAAFVAVIVVFAAVGGIAWGIGVLAADLYGRGEARKQIHSAESRIAAYDHFYNLCASVQALEGSLEAQNEELRSASNDDRNRILANIAGLQGERLRAIHQYNADARKSYTIGQFRASDLPYQLSDEYWKEGVNTSCEA